MPSNTELTINSAAVLEGLPRLLLEDSTTADGEVSVDWADGKYVVSYGDIEARFSDRLNVPGFVLASVEDVKDWLHQTYLPVEGR